MVRLPICVAVSALACVVEGLQLGRGQRADLRGASAWRSRSRSACETWVVGQVAERGGGQAGRPGRWTAWSSSSASRLVVVMPLSWVVVRPCTCVVESAPSCVVDRLLSAVVVRCRSASRSARWPAWCEGSATRSRSACRSGPPSSLATWVAVSVADLGRRSGCRTPWWSGRSPGRWTAWSTLERVEGGRGRAR